MANTSFLIFSGHNNRAVISLCRYFKKSGLDFCLISSGADDPIYRTIYGDKVILQRTSSKIDRTLFSAISIAAKNDLIYCPTTEFINNYLVENPDTLAGLPITANLPNKCIYQSVTEKYTSQLLVSEIKNLNLIDIHTIPESTAPCVLKPFKNVINGTLLYPIFCMSEEELKSTVQIIDTSLYFSQPYINGKSYYLCGYLSKQGIFKYFWQENLVQQDGGKSILLARESKKPGVIEQEFFNILYKREYHGPVMLEVMLFNSTIYYIEINPRFWGPLQLTLDSCPEILDLFAIDNGLPPKYKVNRKNKEQNYYSWHDGINGNIRNYTDMDTNKIESLMIEFDIYSTARD